MLTYVPAAVFWALIIAGYLGRVIDGRRALIFIAIWFVLTSVVMTLEIGSALTVLVYVILDIVLLLKYFGGDIR